jgi:effector-binding domain-containing protein
MKKVIYILLALFALYLVLALFGPKRVNVEREITINRPSSAYFDKLGDYRFFNAVWNPWPRLDSAIKIDYSGESGKPGHRYDWDGNDKVRSGAMEITAMKQDTIEQKVYFGKNGSMGIADARFSVTGNEAASSVKWQMGFDVPFMKRPMMMFMNMDKMMGPQFEKGLSDLKTEVEKKQSEGSSQFEIQEENWEARSFVSSTHSTIPMEKIGMFLGSNFPRMMQDLEKHHMKPLMAPCAGYFSWDDKTKVSECAALMQVPNGTEIKGWEKYEVPASRVLKLVYTGSYYQMEPAYNALHKYMNEKNYKHSLAMEEYVTDPMMEKDSSKWVTNIYYLVKGENTP